MMAPVLALGSRFSRTWVIKTAAAMDQLVVTGDSSMNDNSRSSSERTGGGASVRQASRKRANGAMDVNDRVQRHIGQQLKAMYDAIVNEAVPENLIDLLREADGATKRKKSE